MSIMVDLAVIILIGIFTIVGLKRGFAREVIDFVIALLLIPICNNYIVETVIKLKDSENVLENKKNDGLLETEINKIIRQNKDKGIDEVAKIAGNNITDGIIKGIAFVATYTLLSLVILIFRNTILGLIENIRNI